ncbi:hypothetical protein H0H87_008664 [Tephrocybe sp. NHM501043]|nr:hypothetical protein H0H87_008664 [Tephrocybe sp. NHM501043]
MSRVPNMLSPPEITDPASRIIEATLAIDPTLKMSGANTAALTTSAIPAGLRIDTMILTSHDNLLLLCQGIFRGQPHSNHGSGHHQPNVPHVRRFWATSGDINLPGMGSGEWINYRGLDVVMRNAEVLGIGNRSLDVLDYALEHHDFEADPYMDTWNARHAVFFGSSWRWNSLKNSQGGALYLSRITHLTMWLDDDSGGSGPDGLPAWVKSVPFHMMSSLIHFECPLANRRSRVLTEMRVYTAQRPGTIHRWFSDPARCAEHYRPARSTQLVSVEDLLQW